jgi:hypothetical protein
MTRIALSIALFLAWAPSAGAAAAPPVSARPLPADVRAFVARRDHCDHFRGEDSDDPARQREIARSLERYCAGTDTTLARLKARYRGNVRVAHVLSRYDPNVE